MFAEENIVRECDMRTAGDTAGTKTTVQPCPGRPALTGSLGERIIDRDRECTVAAHVGSGGNYSRVQANASLQADTNNNHDHHRNLEATEHSHGGRENNEHSWTKCKSKFNKSSSRCLVVDFQDSREDISSQSFRRNEAFLCREIFGIFPEFLNFHNFSNFLKFWNF